MAKVTQTLSVTVDDVTYNVADMSDQVKQMIELMDEWRQQEVDISGQLVMVRSAIRDIQNSLLLQIRQEQAQVAQAAAGETASPVNPEAPAAPVAGA